ncbi:hypothetical protein [Streptomyces koyangensis]|uniref:Uncharacterized protein n=1 Tax=Streptomyces koyangensis TaxID=188770 RepID=A0ABX7E7F8_9ACTN|nr:hypothetical protein [Streptomyces koyangensis]QRF00721.1 hypothetical protein G9U55_08510 [Streptomyces koyangensis]
MAEEFLDHDEFDSLFQQQGRGRVPEVVKSDAAEAGIAGLTRNCGGSQPGYSDLCRCDPEKPRSEAVLDAGLFEHARDRALDIVGPIDTGSWQRRQGTMASAVDTFGRDTGFTATSGGQYRSFRLDTDPGSARAAM